MTFHRQVLAAGFLAVALTGYGCQKPADENVQAARENNADDKVGLSQADAAFLKQAEVDSIKERSIARNALEKSQNGDVRDYADMLVDDHSKALENAVDLLEKKGMPQPDGLPEAKQEALGKLDGATGPGFDREFVNMMVMDHEKAISAFRTHQGVAQDADVKEYIDDTLPTLEKHLEKARELQGKLGGARSE